MIKNVVFDFGQVLIHFKEEQMVSPYLSDAEDARTVGEVVFDRVFWDRLDAGTITDDEVVAGIKERLPVRLHAAAEEVYRNWYHHTPEIDGMRELIRRLKREFGVRILVLSNISRTFAEHYTEIPILSEAEGCVFSAVCGYVKPNAEIFAHLCERFSILPSETVFIDDNAKNIRGAEAFGIKGYLFDGDASALGRYLDELLSENHS